MAMRLTSYSYSLVRSTLFLRVYQSPTCVLFRPSIIVKPLIQHNKLADFSEKLTEPESRYDLVVATFTFTANLMLNKEKRIEYDESLAFSHMIKCSYSYDEFSMAYSYFFNYTNSSTSLTPPDIDGILVRDITLFESSTTISITTSPTTSNQLVAVDPTTEETLTLPRWYSDSNQVVFSLTLYPDDPAFVAFMNLFSNAVNTAQPITLTFY